MWSKAWEGDTPNFLKTFLKAIFIVISNAFFLIPKRNVKIEIQNYTQQLKSVKDINIFNQTLENFYNKDGEEIIKYKKHFLYFDNIKTKKEPEIIA
jgi:long-chain-fatty-acid--[acyl-carrier-protein] ligase